MVKPEPDHPVCPDCGEKVYNRQDGVATPVGVYHSICDLPSRDEL